MKKVIIKALVLAFALAMFTPTFTRMARAEDFNTTDKKWKVTFTNGKKMVSNFKTKNMDDTLSQLQPGDNALFEITLKNEYSATTDWYMSNKVLHSLEDASKTASGGAYFYKLVYTDSKKKDTVLFDSTKVGGEEENISPAGEGLHEATDQLEEYFFLDDMKKGQTGKITLEVGLDGETQGNDYQDTRADLQMNFAVELPQTTSNEGGNKTVNRTVNRTIQEMRDAVKTGDERNMVPFFILGCISGLILLIIGFYSLSLRRKESAQMAAPHMGKEE